MYRRPVAFKDGETLIACAVCGFAYLYPSELTYTDEHTFRCNRTCLDEETKLTHDRRRAAWAASRTPDQISPLLPGTKPSYRD
jgi:hypothetical protein